MGDSAGGGLLLALVLKMKKEGIALPSQLIMLSPWLDISMTNLDMLPVEKYDPALTIEGPSIAGLFYANGSDTKNWPVGPLYGNLRDLPTMSLFSGTHEIMNADHRKFKSLCESKDVLLNYFEYLQMMHVWPIFGIPESEKAIRQIAELIASNGQKV